LIKNIKRKLIRIISRLLVSVIFLISKLFDLSILESGKLNIRFGYLLCRRFSSSYISLTIYSIFFNENSKHATRLQELKTYTKVGNKYRKVLMSLEKSLLGKTLVWRNKHTNNIKSRIKSEQKNKKILFVTRSWHFFNPLFEKMKNSSEPISKFDINDYDKVYLSTETKKVNKNKVFRDLLFSSLKNTPELDNINDYSKLSNLNKNDLDEISSSDVVFDVIFSSIKEGSML